MNDSVRLLNIRAMTRISALLAIYGLLLLILGDLLQKDYIGWSAITTIAGILLVALATCRLIMERMSL